MGVDTDFIGHIAIRPPLSEGEQQYLSAFSSSRRFRRPGGPYAVPRNPAAEREDAAPWPSGSNLTAEGQPSFWCQWVPAWDGTAITYNGDEKFYAASRWLQYLIDHFLAPGALAARSRPEWFEEFTFDHHLDGVVAAYARDTGELYLIRVADNVVRQELVGGSAVPSVDRPPLPYQSVRDERAQRRRRRVRN